MISAHNKIGFYTGSGGEAGALDTYFSKLDQNGIPFVVKAVDDYQVLETALQFTQAPHVLIYRVSTLGQENRFEFDEPDYRLAPDAAAFAHWEALAAALPSNFDRDRIWLEPIVTPDVRQIDWLGRFAVAYAEIARREGLKLLQFSFATGEPDQADWQAESMLTYLRLCAEHPTQFGIGLHEYSYEPDDIWAEQGFRIGRFTQLFDACDLNGINRPTVVMTEWGWSSVEVPSPELALEHIQQVNELYGRYPEVLGAALWRLGSGSKGIGRRVATLVDPITDFSISWSLETEPELAESIPAPVNIDPRPNAEPEEEDNLGTLSIEESVSLEPGNLRYVADVTIPDHTPIPAGESFTKTWRVRNTGRSTWDADHRLVFKAGEQMGAPDSIPLPRALPGDVVNISIDLTVPSDLRGRQFGDWQLVDAQGNRVGDILYFILNVTKPKPRIAEPVGTDDSAYVADVTIPDNTRMEKQERFTKTWRIRNIGDTDWVAGYTFEHIGGPQLASSPSVSLPACKAGQAVDVSVEMHAPNVAGEYRSEWRPRNQDGTFFGEFVFLKIVVPEPVPDSPVPLFSQIDPRWRDKTLGTRFSDKTIGDWGCLMTCFTMVANYYGKSHTPSSMNDRMLDRSLFIDAKVTPFRLLDRLYTDVIFGGRLESRHHPNITDRIDASLAAGHPVTVHVDVTPLNAYTTNDQHWVLIVGKDGQDYRIHDPLVHPAEPSSLRNKYSKPNEPLNETIRAAIFYRSVRSQLSLLAPVAGGPVPETADAEVPEVAETPVAVGTPTEVGTPTVLPQLQTGMNINPDAPHSDPRDSKLLKGVDWVRFVFKIDAQPDPNQRNLRAAITKYADLINDYKRQGIKSLVILNQETVWGSAPWATGASWETYAKELGRVSEQIARRFRRLGDGIAYQIWNEGDAVGHSSIFVPPEQFAPVLRETAKGVRRGSPQSPIIFGGIMGGPGTGIPYVQTVKATLGGELPIDALGIHPYGKWGTKAPFDWGEKFGTLTEEFEQYGEAFPGMPLWITEMGVANATPLGAETYRDTAMYLEDVYTHISQRHTAQVPVVIWFAWSDFMRNAGIVTQSGARKNHVFTAFEKIRDRLIF